MSLRSGTQKYGVESGWFTEHGYTRNLEVEKKLNDKFEEVSIEANKPLLDDNGNQVGSWLPISTPEPSWWVVESCDPQGCVPYAITPEGRFRPDPRITPDEAIKYLTRALNFKQAEIDRNNYRCHYYPRDTVFCQHAQQAGGYIGRIRKMINIIKQAQQEYQQPQQGGFDIIPQVFAEEDPSINSGLNGNEQESQVVNYPQSANVRIVISNISMFSTSIPINDIGQLQALSNESNEWRYTLIGHGSTNPPLMTLSGLINKINSMIASAVTPQPPIQPPIQLPIQPPIEEEPVTTDHVEPPEVEPEVPMVTVTPTEPGQVNWIPEPFFSFINNVFRVR